MYQAVKYFRFDIICALCCILRFTAILCVCVSLFYKRRILNSPFTKDRRKLNNATQKHDTQTKWRRKTWKYYTLKLIPIAKLNFVLIKWRTCVLKGKERELNETHVAHIHGMLQSYICKRHVNRIFSVISRRSDISSFSYFEYNFAVRYYYQ